MSYFTRREFMGVAALGALGVAGQPCCLLARARGAMKIVDIESHEVLLPYRDHHAVALFRHLGVRGQRRIIFVLKTDNGLEGYGEGHEPASREGIAEYIGTDPFDWLAESRNLAINMAIYDLLGKYLGLPAWKLLGQKVHSWVPMAAWTVSQPPQAMAEEVLNASERGYRWLKYHVNALQNAIDQTAAMQKVAPPGFKVHYDFNGDSDLEAVYPVLKELEKFPVAGRVEDPINSKDHGGYRILRQKCSLPMLLHHGPHDFFMLNNLCDAVMGGNVPVGINMKLAALAESTNTPFMLQQTGGTINQMFLTHQAAVFKMAIIDHVTQVDIWKDSVTVETPPMVGGSIEVPDRPGLGVTLDRQKLQKYKAGPRPKQKRFLVHVRYTNGPEIYFGFDADGPKPILHRPYIPELVIPGYANPVVSDFRDDEGSPDFERLWKQAESGPVWTPLWTEKEKK